MSATCHSESVPSASAAQAEAGSHPQAYDELTGQVQAAAPPCPIEAATHLTPPWQAFLAELGEHPAQELNQRMVRMQRQIRDNGVSYNIHADPANPQRPWALDLFPMVISPDSWRQIETGVRQRVGLLEAILRDVYGPQTLLQQGLLPAALVHGHPGYLRMLRGHPPAGGNYLHIAAFDVVRGPDGLWWVMSQRTEAPSGLGYLLENRLAIARQFPEAFQSLRIQRLAASYSALIEQLKRASGAGADAHVALLTPGPYNETYFEHAYLARYLGLTLVEGHDLTVRDEHLFLKTVQGLQPVHVLLKRLDDEFLDPLELRSDSRLGVPGLLQAVRAGHVVMANAPGTAVLQSPALLGFEPALARRLLGEELRLPALPTWWCGERAALGGAMAHLAEAVIKPTYPDTLSGFDAVRGGALTTDELKVWRERLSASPESYTVQSHLTLSRQPVWHPGSDDRGLLDTRAVVLRVFALADGPQSWRVLPGGLARLVNAEAGMASMQRGGSSADVWVMTRAEAGQSVDATTLLHPPRGLQRLAPRHRLVTSRSGENLFWLGRYTERAENTVRLARLVLDQLHGDGPHRAPMLGWLSAMAWQHSLIGPGLASAPGTDAAGRRQLGQALLKALGDTRLATSVGFNLAALQRAAAAVRERLSQEHWHLIVQTHDDFIRQCHPGPGQALLGPTQAQAALESANMMLAAITGAQTDRMTRDDGWRLLSIGRHIERLGFLANALGRGFDLGALSLEPAGPVSPGFEAMLALFDSTITFRAQYQQSRDIADLLELLVLDMDNPRSLGWVAQTLRGRLAKLCGHGPGEMGELSHRVPRPADWPSLLGQLPAESVAATAGLRALLTQCETAAYTASEDVSARFFTHSGSSEEFVGT